MWESFEKFHAKCRASRYLRVFSWLVRLALAAGFIPSGMVKILGERFTALPDYHPMGAYLEALHHTGWYYTSIGVFQVLAALLLLIPRTAVLGLFIYLPIILNITLLSLSVRFDGSLVTAPLMVVACLFLLLWHFEQWKFILPPFQKLTSPKPAEAPNWKWNLAMTGIGVLVVVGMASWSIFGFEVLPRNKYEYCLKQCPELDNTEACEAFCDCVHIDQHKWKDCIANYNNHEDETD